MNRNIHGICDLSPLPDLLRIGSRPTKNLAIIECHIDMQFDKEKASLHNGSF